MIVLYNRLIIHLPKFSRLNEVHCWMRMTECYSKSLVPTEPVPPASPEEARSRFRVVNTTAEQEQQYDVVGERHLPKPSGVVASVAHLVKGALGSGILSGHVAYMKVGLMVALPMNFLLGVYMTYCLYILVRSAQVLYRRTGIPSMSYPDVGEAALACFPNPKVAKFSRCFRYCIDVTICLDLFGSCTTYMIIIAKTVKQLVENTQQSMIAPIPPGTLNLRIYIMMVASLCIIICMLRHLQWLAPFSIVGNTLILICIMVTIVYAFQNNPHFENIVLATSSAVMLFEFIGMVVFSMSCAGVVIAIENNMKEPHKFGVVLIIGMSIIVTCTCTCSSFGYIAYLDKSDAPITVNFPMTTLPKVLKGFIAVMITITFALNFWVPFNICFYYIAKLHDKKRIIMWELIYRGCIVVGIMLIGVTFPSISGLMGFLGCFCLSNMAFIWPNLIELLVVWHRPGLGYMKWRLWKCLILIIIGFILWCCGTVVSVKELVNVVTSKKSS